MSSNGQPNPPGSGSGPDQKKGKQRENQEEPKTKYESLSLQISDAKRNLDSTLSRLDSNPDNWFRDYSNRNDGDIKKKPIENFMQIKNNVSSAYTELNSEYISLQPVIDYYKNIYNFLSKPEAPLNVIDGVIIFKDNDITGNDNNITIINQQLLNSFDIGKYRLIPFLFRSSRINYETNYTNFNTQVKVLLNSKINLTVELPDIFNKKLISLINNNFDSDFENKLYMYFDQLSSKQDPKDKINIKSEINKINYSDSDKDLFNAFSRITRTNFVLGSTIDKIVLPEANEFMFSYLNAGTALNSIIPTENSKNYIIRALYFFENDYSAVIQEQLSNLKAEVDKKSQEKKQAEQIFKPIKKTYDEELYKYRIYNTLITDLEPTYTNALTARNAYLDPNNKPKSGVSQGIKDDYFNAIITFNTKLDEIKTNNAEFNKEYNLKYNPYTTDPSKINQKDIKYFDNKSWDDFLKSLGIREVPVEPQETAQYTDASNQLIIAETELTAANEKYTTEATKKILDTDLFKDYNFWYLKDKNNYTGYKLDPKNNINETSISKTDLLAKTTTNTNFLVLIENISKPAPEPAAAPQGALESQVPQGAQGAPAASGSVPNVLEQANAGSGFTANIPVGKPNISFPIFSAKGAGKINGGGNHTSISKDKEIDPDSNFLYTSTFYLLSHIPGFITELNKINTTEDCISYLKDAIINTPTTVKDYGILLDSMDDSCNQNYQYADSGQMIKTILNSSNALKPFIGNNLMFDEVQYDCNYNEEFCKVYDDKKEGTNIEDNIILDMKPHGDYYIKNKTGNLPSMLITKNYNKSYNEVLGVSYRNGVLMYYQHYNTIASILSKVKGDKKIYSVLLKTKTKGGSIEYYYYDKEQTVPKLYQHDLDLFNKENGPFVTEYELHVLDKPLSFPTGMTKTNIDLFKTNLTAIKNYFATRPDIIMEIDKNPELKAVYDSNFNINEKTFDLTTQDKLIAINKLFEILIKQYYEKLPSIKENTAEKAYVEKIKTVYIPNINILLSNNTTSIIPKNVPDFDSNKNTIIFNLLNTSIDYIVSKKAPFSTSRGIFQAVKNIRVDYSGTIKDVSNGLVGIISVITAENKTINSIKQLLTIRNNLRFFKESLELLNRFKSEYSRDYEKMTEVAKLVIEVYKKLSNPDAFNVKEVHNGLFNYYKTPVLKEKIDKIQTPPTQYVDEKYVFIDKIESTLKNIEKTYTLVNNLISLFKVPSMIIGIDIGIGDETYIPEEYNYFVTTTIKKNGITNTKKLSKKETASEYDINSLNTVLNQELQIVDLSSNDDGTISVGKTLIKYSKANNIPNIYTDSHYHIPKNISNPIEGIWYYVKPESGIVKIGDIGIDNPNKYNTFYEIKNNTSIIIKGTDNNFITYNIVFSLNEGKLKISLNQS
jgi:hypothetical protein